MKKYNLMLVGLVFSLVMLMGIIFQQHTSAQSGDLGCGELSNCKGTAHCNQPGSASGCTITCQGGDTITCPKSGGGGGEEPENN